MDRCQVPGCETEAANRTLWCFAHSGGGGGRAPGKGKPRCSGALRRKTLLDAFDGRVYHCATCSYVHANPSVFDVDAKDAGKGHVAGNLWLLCPTCHREKSLTAGDFGFMARAQKFLRSIGVDV